MKDKQDERLKKQHSTSAATGTAGPAQDNSTFAVTAAEDQAVFTPMFIDEIRQELPRPFEA
jgi:hypothetical protein